MFLKKTIRDIDLKDKSVLLRTDYNVPIKNGKITDDYRIIQSLDTIKYLLNQNSKIVIISHLGRPKGESNPDFSLFPVAKRLQELLDKPVEFVPDCIGDKVENAKQKLANGHILLLENLRFYKGEEDNDENFAQELAKNSEVFIQDAFGVVHRAHASTSAITKILPSVAGLLLEKEVDTITEAIKNPKRPLATIVGGAKVSDKIDVINEFVEIADFMAIGGAMANTFLVALGIDVGKSIYGNEDVPIARDILAKVAKIKKERDFIFCLPFDGVVSKKMESNINTRIVDWSTNVISDIEFYPKKPPIKASKIASDELILDIGPFSGAFIAGALQLSNTLIWNGTMGVTEVPAYHDPIGPYAHGTDLIIQSLMGDFGKRPFSVVGGGDTVGYIESRNLKDAVDHLSTGGGASLELMSGHKLPGLEALMDK